MTEVTNGDVRGFNNQLNIHLKGFQLTDTSGRAA